MVTDLHYRAITLVSAWIMTSKGGTTGHLGGPGHSSGGR